MRWFKHYADASDDEFIAIIEDRFGLEGYARWWKLLEVIAKQMDKTGRCSATYPLYKWETFLKAKRKQMLCFLEATEKQGKTKLIRSGNVLTIECPKLLEIRDEYSKKSGHTPDKCPPKKKEAEVDAEQEELLKEGGEDPVFVSIKLKGSDGELIVRESYVRELEKTYDRLDVRQALKNILGWTNATPEKRWTKRGAKKAIASWCARDIANKSNLKTQTIESRYVKCRNPEKHPPCNTTWNLMERPNCPRCGWKYEALSD